MTRTYVKGAPVRFVHAPFVKICCIADISEARVAIRAGASALGLVTKMPSGPGILSHELIAEIADRIPPPIASFLLTARQDAQGIIEQFLACRTNTLQFVDHVPFEELRRIRSELRAARLVQVIHITGPESIQEAREVAPLVDALLLDSGNPKLPVKELGGTGRTHDWKISREIRDTVDKPIFLAGGLGKDNIAQAIEAVRPFGVDLCSAVRTEGALDSKKVNDFFEAVDIARHA